MATTEQTQKETMTETIAEIARTHLGIETLESRNNDALDFHEVAVWKLASMLEAAYLAGMAAASARVAQTADEKIDALRPGGSIELSRNDEGTRVIAERSGDGKRVRIVRIHADGERVLGYDIVLDQAW